MEGLRGRWLSFAEQASSPTSMLSGAATATAAVLLAFPFHSSFPEKIAKVSLLTLDLYFAVPSAQFRQLAATAA